jgi:nitroreductase
METMFRVADQVPVSSTLEAILEVARWAPSADNTQPWRFEITQSGQLVVHGSDTRADCVYDLDGRISQLAVGALLETIRIAATVHGLECVAERRGASAETHPTFDLRFFSDPAIARDPLVDAVRARTVQRRALSTRPLTSAEIGELEASVGPDYRVCWLQSTGERLRLTRMLVTNGRLRLRLREAFDVHRNAIDWNATESIDKLPDRAIGLDPVSLRLTRWAFRSWERFSFLDRYLAGTVLASVELDLVPGLACAAHFLIVAARPPTELDDFIEGGRALQRFWLTATRLGLLLQPEVSPLVFARYHRNGVRYTASPACEAVGDRVSSMLAAQVGEDTVARSVFMGRIGEGRQPRARSTRLPLATLLRSNRSAGRSVPHAQGR